MPSLLRQRQAGRSSRKGSKETEPNSVSMAFDNLSKVNSSSSKARETAHREFLAATAKSWGRFFAPDMALPDLETAFSSFKEIYPRYCETLAIETLRGEEYGHLAESGRICLDYCGFGLFSYLQQLDDWESASFALASMSVNLCAHALFGAAKEGTTECDIRKRIMEYLNIQDTEYSMVFTATRGAAFKLLADAYPFSTARRLVTMYDYESESLNWLVQHAKEKGAKVTDVSFKWPSLRIVSTRLRKVLISKGRRRKKGSATGLFVFPVQSRVSGAKYSYQWMSLAQQNNWHVLLDASAVGPKELDSLGLSMFKPDFIIASFYKVFGADPSGFGCLFIKNSALQTVQSQSTTAAPGIVRIIPFPTTWSSSELSVEKPDASSEGSVVSAEDDEENSTDFEFPKSCQLIQGVPSFSGPMLGFDRFSPSAGSQEEPKQLKDEDDDDSSVSDSAGGVSRSPVFSEEGTENLFCLDVCTSPGGTASRASMSDDQLSGPFSGPIHNPAFDGQLNLNAPRGLQNPLYDDGSGSVRTKTKEKVKSVTPVNDRYDCMIGSMADSSKSAEEGPFPLPNGNAQRKAYSSPEGSKAGLSNIQCDPSHCIVRNADSRTAISDCQQSQLQNHHSEIEIVQDSTHAAQAKDITAGNCSWNQKESAIRRETEGDFRLLGRRGNDRPMYGHAFSPLDDPESLGNFGQQDKSLMSVEQAVESYHGDDGSSDLEDEHGKNNEKSDEQDSSEDRDPEVVCRSLDHADMLGLNKSTLRHRYLINWLVSSLLQLQHPGNHNTKSLVRIYGPQIKYDRGASVAFNLYDCLGKLIHPELVQMLADQNNVSLSIGFLKNLQVSENHPELHLFEDSRKVSSKGLSKGSVALRVEVVTAALSILSSFEDVYKLWLFVSRFLDADFVKRELSGSQEALVIQDK